MNVETHLEGSGSSNGLLNIDRLELLQSAMAKSDHSRFDPSENSRPLTVPDIFNNTAPQRNVHVFDGQNYRHLTRYNRDGSITITRTGEGSENNFKLETGEAGSFVQHFEGGQRLEVRPTHDGGTQAVSSGPRELDNYKLTTSADRRECVIEYASGRRVKIERDEAGKMQSITSSSKVASENYEQRADYSVTHASFMGRWHDPADIQAWRTSSNAMDAEAQVNRGSDIVRWTRDAQAWRNR